MRRQVSMMTCLAAAASIALAPLAALAESITVPKGTDVNLVFDEALTSKTAKVGQSVKMHVAEDVTVGDKAVIKSGTPVTGVISKVEKRKHFGVNAKMQITLNPVKAADGTMIALDPKDKGKMTDRQRTGTAAATAGGGAVLLGPIGLAGGYFVVGKPVKIKPGDHLVSTVAQDVAINMK